MLHQEIETFDITLLKLQHILSFVALNYVGCYIDTDARDLSYAAHSSMDSNNMTVQACIAECQSQVSFI